MKFSATLLLMLLALQQQVFSQSPKYRVVGIPVEKDSKALRYPWTGGMNAPQFSACDLNNDGTKDLFIFDRVGNKVLTYLNVGTNTDTAFVYAPQYESLFPDDLEHWALIRDYNNDNIPDIFTRAVYYNGNPYVGTRVFKGKIENGHLAFDLVQPVLYYNDGQYNVNIWTNVDDIPVYTDVNLDGDIDILTFGIFGSSVEYYENLTVENQGNPAYDVDSFKYTLSTICWGNFAENGLTNSIALNLSCKGNGMEDGNSEGNRHSGSTIYNFDADNDHDVDLLLGDISFNNLVFAKNCGDSSFANICSWDSLFPSCNTPAILPIFPAAFGVDVDNNGLEDLLVAPNARQGATDVNNVLLYRNTGNTACQFNYVSDTFLVHHSLDFGTDSKPVFFDFNGDGLHDIVIGNYGYFRPFTTYKSALAVYENTGTSSSPKYEEVIDDYNNFSSFNLIAMHPAFGDLDGDNKDDMIMGELTGFLHFFKNTGSTQANFPSMTTPQYFGLDVGQYSAPFIYDVNGDNLNDLVVGKRDGKISYFWNFGTPTAPLFHDDSVNTFFGNINVNLPGYLDGYTSPHLQKDSANNLLLYTGSSRGLVFKYLVNPANLRSGSFQLIDSNILKHPVGSKSTISIADLNNDGHSEYITGTSRGGLQLYSDTVWDNSALPVAVNEVKDNIPSLHFYPNPAKDYIMCRINGSKLNRLTVDILDMLGRQISTDVAVNGNLIRINTSSFSRGVYVVRISEQEHSYTGKFIVE